jgi:hypothetical protein
MEISWSEVKFNYRDFGKCPGERQNLTRASLWLIHIYASCAGLLGGLFIGWIRLRGQAGRKKPLDTRWNWINALPQAIEFS